MKDGAYSTDKPPGNDWSESLPTNWKFKKLKYLSQIDSSGVWGEDPVEGTSECRVVTTANIDMQGNIHTEEITVRSLSKEELELGSCIPGDIIVVKSSGSATNIVSGKAGLVKDEHLPICFSNFTLRVRPTPGVLDAHFAWHFLNSEVVRAQIRLMVATTTYPNLQVEEYVSFLLPVPNYEDQRTIANYLDLETARLDGLLATKERQLELLAEKERMLITQAVTCGLDQNVPVRDSGIEWLPKIPTHWETDRAKWLFRERDERSESGAEELLSVSHLTGVTPRSEKDVNMFEAETTEGYKICRPGDLVINTLWAWMGAMGVSPVHGIVSPAYNVYVPGERLDPGYVDALVRIRSFAEEATRFSKGVWSSRLRLYPEGFFEIWIPIPPLDEQRAIITFIASETAKLEALRGAAERTIGLLKERRAALIAAVVTGQMDVVSAT